MKSIMPEAEYGPAPISTTRKGAFSFIWIHVMKTLDMETQGRKVCFLARNVIQLNSYRRRYILYHKKRQVKTIDTPNRMTASPSNE